MYSVWESGSASLKTEVKKQAVVGIEMKINKPLH